MGVKVAAGAVVKLGGAGVGMPVRCSTRSREASRGNPRSAPPRPRGAQRVDAEQVGQGAVVHADGLGDLEEPDQLEAVQALGARLVLVDFG